MKSKLKVDLPSESKTSDEVFYKRSWLSKKQNYPYLITNDELAEFYRFQREAHHIIIGKSRFGKTVSATKNIFIDIASCYHSCIVIDPEGELADFLMASKEVFSAFEQKRLIYISPDNPNLAINILNQEHGVYLVDLMKRLDSTTFSDTMISPLSVCLEVCKLYRGTLLDVYNLVTENHSIRVAVNERLIADGHEELANKLTAQVYKASKSTLAGIASRLNKILLSPYLKKFLCSVKETLNFREIFDSITPKVVIVNLGARYQDTALSFHEANLLGQIIISIVQLVCMKRKNLTQVFCYIDEAQDILSEEAAACIVSRGAKYRLSVIMITQGFSGISNSVRDRLLQAVNIIQTFRCSSQNANLIAQALDLKHHDSKEGADKMPILDGIRYEGVVWNPTNLRKYLSIAKTPQSTVIVDYAKDNISLYSIGRSELDLKQIVYETTDSPLCVFKASESLSNIGAAKQYNEEWRKPNEKHSVIKSNPNDEADLFGFRQAPKEYFTDSTDELEGF